jgi:RNA polymerase sigma-70 factor (ECF subfamily)
MSSFADSDETDELIARSLDGDPFAFRLLHDRYRVRLRSLIVENLDPRLAARLDASDIVQEVFVKASKRLREYSERNKTSFFVWLQGLANDSLIDAHRFHVRSQRRSVNRERKYGRNESEDSMRKLADKLCDSGISPSQEMIRSEAKEKVLRCVKVYCFTPNGTFGK